MSDILSLGDSESEFSGFDSDDLSNNNSKIKSKVVCTKVATNKGKECTKKKKDPVCKTGSKHKALGKESKGFDFSKMTEKDLSNLKAVLGISDNRNEELPNLHISLDRDDVPDGEIYLDYEHEDGDQGYTAQKLSDALFESHEEVSEAWNLPKLKAPEKGPPINPNLANLIDTACILPCETDPIVGKYKMPGNCKNLGAPLVNNEVWKILDRRAKSQDRAIADIQNLLSTGMLPVIRLAEILKPQIQGNDEAKSLLSDMLTILGQVQYQLSIRRRYLIRPNINKKYTNLCNVNTPISSLLFGDDVGKEIKNCDTGVSLARDSFRYRGRGFSRPYRIPRRGHFNSGSGYEGRFSPYPQRGQFRGAFQRPYSQRGRRTPVSATITSDQAKN